MLRFMGVTALILSIATSDNICQINRTFRVVFLSFYMLVVTMINIFNFLTAISTKIELLFQDTLPNRPANVVG